MDNLKIEIPSLKENIRIVESFIDNAKDRFNIDDDIYGNIMVTVTEAVNNSIVHGNACDQNKNVRLTLHFEDNAMTFLIEDEGTGFDHENLSDPTSPENLEKPGGRGIFLMKSLCDELNFYDEGKKVELKFYLN